MVKKSMLTLEEAKQQYDTLQTKMKRLDNLEETLRKEIDSFKDKIDRAKSEVTDKFDRIDYMKEFFNNEQKKMQDNLKFLEKNRNNYEKLVSHCLIIS
jgi:chromosome segregation ATPase